jgi:thiol:disulfide interchange protein
MAVIGDYALGLISGVVIAPWLTPHLSRAFL